MKTTQIGDNRYLLFDDERLLDWCAERIEYVDSARGWKNQKAQAVGLAIGFEIVAAMVVSNYNPRYRNCEISFAATRANWATRTSIAALMAYPFNQLGCTRVTTIIASANARAIRFNLGLGFEQEGFSPRGYGDDHAVMFGLLRENAPAWMGLAQIAKLPHKVASMAVTA